MIDFIKFYVNPREEFLGNLENNNLVDLKSQYNYNTGELYEFPKTGYNKGMFVKITEHRAFISGSIHKYFNLIVSGKKHNYNDFSYSDFLQATEHLKNEFSLSPEDCKITNLEFGLNLKVKRDPQQIIDENILMFNFRAPNRDEKFSGKGDYLEFQKTDYSVKIYNKSKQNNLKGINILRIELKIKRSRYLNKQFGIYSLKDIDTNSYLKLFRKLMEHFDKLLIIDHDKAEKLSKISSLQLFNNGINPTYWRKFRKSNKAKQRFKIQFEDLLNSLGFLETKNSLKIALLSNYNRLVDCNIDSSQLSSA